GLVASVSTVPSDDAEGTRGQPSLPSHLERVIARLTSLRAGDDRSLDEAIEAVIRELDTARVGAKSRRGEARDGLLERLRTLERDLLEAARARLAPVVIADIEREADAELAPFREPMPAD